MKHEKTASLCKGMPLTALYVEAMTMEGKCLARANGRVVFLRGGAPGDTVSATLTKIKKNFLEARVVHIEKRSTHREVPFCEHFGLCGGCVWQHVNYPTQLRYKSLYVRDALARIGGLTDVDVAPIAACTHTTMYRNRLDFTFTARGWLTRQEMESGQEPLPGLGFHLPGLFDKVFDVQTCHLQAHPSNAIRLSVRDAALAASIPFFDLRSQEGFLRTLTIRTASTGETMVILQVAYEAPEWIDRLLKPLADRFPQIVSFQYAVNAKRNDTFQGLEMRTWRGKPYIAEQIDIDGLPTLRLRIGPTSFYQTNLRQTCRLYAIVLEMAALTGNEVAYDLYTGVGSIASVLALRAKRVVGLEWVEEAVKDARQNARLNALNNVSFFAGDIKDMLTDAFFLQHGRPDVVVVDPPRAGLHKKVCAALCKALPERIVYVSCNPATQARDLKALSERFTVERAQPIDLFPHTNHVENVALLRRIDAADSLC